jgi:hypothetical protein
MDWRIIVFAFLQLIKADTDTLLDTTTFTTELSRNGWQFPNNSKWQDVSGNIDEDNTVRVLQICEMKGSKAGNNWVHSPKIDTRQANQVQLEIRFAIRACRSMRRSRECREKFTIFFKNADLYSDKTSD